MTALAVRHELVVHAYCASHTLPPPTVEHQFAHPRRWRFDFAWVPWHLALEVEGGVWTKGRHTRGAGYLADITKYNRATVLGWRVLRCTPDTMLSGLEDVRTMLEAHRP